MDRIVKVAELSTYDRGWNPDVLCVKPTAHTIDANGMMPMCGEPASFVGVRRADGWVSGTAWCAAHVEADSDAGRIFDSFDWCRIEGR